MSNFQNTIEEVRSRVDIVDIISDHVTLKKSGKNWMGLCPFHPEKTPSFMVNSEKSLYKCFGCGVGGDAFNFLQRITNQSFGQVLNDLANRYGIKIEYSSENQDIKNQILEVNKLATKFFAENLLDKQIGQNAKEYLNNRNINDDIILNFNLGYAPAGWDNLIKHLSQKHNISVDLIDKAGLITSKDNSDSYYDRFRDRIMIPIQNVRGEIIAFGGRSLTSDNIPKYLNSPETLVFQKGKNLYAIYQAKESIKQEDSVILMEGYFDAISAHSNGITNVVATLGTALTRDQLHVLGKYTDSKRIFIAFDADQAGGSATNRGIEVIKNTFGGLGGIKMLNSTSKDSFYEIRVVSIPNGKDPDEFIRNKGAEAFKNLTKIAPLLLDFQIEQVLKNIDLTSSTGKIKAVKDLSEIINEINSPIIKTEYIKIIAERISVREEDFRNELLRLNTDQRTFKKSGKEESDSKLISRKQPEEIIAIAEKNLISLFFIGEDFWSLISNKLKEVSFSDDNIQLLKSSVDELITDSKDVDDLTKGLLNRLVDNSKAIEILSDIIFTLEDKRCMDNEKVINLFINENLNCIERFKAHNNESELRKRYYAAKDDEIGSLELQYEVRKIVSSRV